MAVAFKADARGHEVPGTYSITHDPSTVLETAQTLEQDMARAATDPAAVPVVPAFGGLSAEKPALPFQPLARM